MKTNLYFLSAIISFCTPLLQAQNTLQINAMNNEVSANLDLRAVASVFGESQNLDDFERRLNDPKLQLSNLDLNNDNLVDYLRVVESIERQKHLILIQAIIDRDRYQDVATIDVEKEYYGNINIQIIGNANLYGSNYIYRPVYYRLPSVLNLFWGANYCPYYSVWKWNYYPRSYYTWNPYPTYRYRHNITVNLDNANYYNSINHRRSRQYESRYDNQRAAYNYSNNNRYDLHRRGFIEDRETRNTNGYYRDNENRNRGETQRFNYNREAPQNRPLEIKDVEIQRNRNQYVTVPSFRKNGRGSRENHRRD